MLSSHLSPIITQAQNTVVLVLPDSLDAFSPSASRHNDQAPSCGGSSGSCSTSSGGDGGKQAMPDKLPGADAADRSGSSDLASPHAAGALPNGDKGPWLNVMAPEWRPSTGQAPGALERPGGRQRQQQQLPVHQLPLPQPQQKTQPKQQTARSGQQRGRQQQPRSQPPQQQAQQQAVQQQGGGDDTSGMKWQEDNASRRQSELQIALDEAQAGLKELLRQRSLLIKAARPFSGNTQDSSSSSADKQQNAGSSAAALKPDELQEVQRLAEAGTEGQAAQGAWLQSLADVATSHATDAHAGGCLFCVNKPFRTGHMPTCSGANCLCKRPGVQVCTMIVCHYALLDNIVPGGRRRTHLNTCT